MTLKLIGRQGSVTRRGGPNTFAKAFISLDPDLPQFNPSSYDIGSATDIPNTFLRTVSLGKVFPTGQNGVVTYGGNVTVETKYGLPGDFATDDVFARSAVTISAEITNKQVEVTYALVPEPETYAMLLGGLALLGWRLRQVQKET